ncbi:hypothetical protein CWE04_08015 [Thomasclavelia cocleata]|uniref:Uncharacterized protein n=1 Tax=Thomasclavelia cocleata TaxID=69824 RepID=A0A1I0GT46_9FIRM|nr:hypothetical protein [Thomasclavelia cocleata]MCR1959488.1 hypothetical protein [Thomasclavelia cocleata]NDO42508.1 hypothetical protein [Thomasclavelia cocleata]PJN80554.1 hypothetical protein CWE04_08015 [Thomasclavelia cocleata]SET74289.1 hypothetical protein SAMN04489758_13515 [Thomasclavelia cocleata]
MLKNKKIIVGVIIIIIGLGIILFMNFNGDTSNTIKKEFERKEDKKLDQDDSNGSISDIELNPRQEIHELFDNQIIPKDGDTEIEYGE